jgi:predicted dehydrogenase
MGPATIGCPQPLGLEPRAIERRTECEQLASAFGLEYLTHVEDVVVMRILIAGLGSIGFRHLKNVKIVEPTAHITVWHLHSKPGSEEQTRGLADAVVYRLEDALDSRPQVAFITGPASCHVESALPMAESGAHLFIEKPLSNVMEGVDELLRACRERRLILMVGYNFRFHRPLQAMREALVEGRIGQPLALRAEVGQFLPDWRPDSDYRQSASARHVLGGGAVLELSHELDYSRWLVGEVGGVVAQVRKVSNLEIDVEDLAEIILKFRNGTIGSVHLDMVQRAPTRSCRVVGTEGTLSWDWADRRVRCYTAQRGGWVDLFAEEDPDRNAMYLEELRHFFACVKSQEPPAVTGEDGRRVLEIALAVKESARTGQVVPV